jgi:hypothetical protein
MSVRVIFLAVFVLLGSAPNVATANESMTGTWRIAWTCDTATGMYKQRCDEGMRDSFTLKIFVKGSKLCALHAATAQMGNRVDEAEGPKPSITGRVGGPNAKATFSSSLGAKGTASLELKGESLEWKLLSQDGGRHWFPSTATLLRVPDSKWGSNLKCPH